MKFVTEFRDRELVEREAKRIHQVVTRPWRIMEVCGGQTHALLRYGLVSLLPEQVKLIHGPGCPVCVTPIEVLDCAVALAEQQGAILCSFGDMLKIPASNGNLFQCRARGGDVRVVDSPLEALSLAQQNPHREVVFLAVGFETTAPAHALAVLQARELGLSNFSLLVSHYLVPPALRLILSNPKAQVDGFLAAGHVCTVMGAEEYRPIVEEFQVPIVVTGFEPVDLMQGIRMVVEQLEAGRAELENQYVRSVATQGNPTARAAIAQVFEPIKQNWRGLGSYDESGLGLRADFAHFDARKKFNLNLVPAAANSCLGGDIMMGIKKPWDCEKFGNECSPDHPLGAPMVSAEGACAAYFKYEMTEKPT
ncbi:MAG: hydrogenase formation protein HypD [Bdellovibrionales bacterium]|nr:hydrogenase formation protein HypD [Bdellovibrionales bacterium]